jgi:hypothetical protein
VADLAQKELGQGQNFLAAPAQRRHLQQAHLQAIVEVFTPGALRNLLLQVLVCGADDAGVGVQFAYTAHTVERALLNEPQQLGLVLQRELADLVQKQRTAGSGFNLAACPLGLPPVKAPARSQRAHSRTACWGWRRS